MYPLLSDIEKIAFKKMLLQECITMIELRMAVASKAMANAQAASNSEEKSSAGDKYETSRAMNHLEKDMYSRQLAANKIELAALYTIDCTSLYNTITTGSFTRCNDTSFFIAAGLGKIMVEGAPVFLLSPYAPLAKQLIGRGIGDLVNFNKQELVITMIF